MPYKFPKVQKYVIDYDNLTDDIFKRSKELLFDTPNLLLDYINTYITQLAAAEQRMFATMKSNPNLIYEMRRHYHNNEVFSQPIYFSDQNLFIHFSVYEILNIINLATEQGNPPPVQYFDVETFYGPERNFIWAPNNSFLTNKIDPIIAVPYPYGYQNFLVIDGNTRLTTWGKQVREVPVIFLDPNFLVEHDLFPSDFDKIIYLFQLDLANLAKKKQDFSLSDKKLLEISYLKTREIHLD